MLKYNEKNAKISDIILELEIEKDKLPLYYELLSKTESPLIWGCFADLLKDSCKNDKEFKDIILGMLESPKTNGARGCLLNAVACFDDYDERTVKILFEQVTHGNLECRNKGADIIKRVLSVADDALKQKTMEMLEESLDELYRRCDLLEQFLPNDSENENDSINTDDT